MIRATTIGVLKNYRSGLNKSFTKLNDSRTTVLTHRTFNSFAEDPSAAALTFQLRRARMTAESNYTVCENSYRTFESAWASLSDVISDVDNATRENSTIKTDALKALNDPTGDARAALSKDLHQLAETLAQVMNNKYGDNFLFSGADGQTVPFTWDEKTGDLLYRGIPVDASVPELEMEKGADGEATADPVTLKLNANGEYDETNGSDHYLVKGKTSLVPIDADNIPANALKQDDGTGKKVPVEFNADGEVTPGGGYYMTVDKGGTISKADYEKTKSDAEKLDYLANKEKYYQDIGLGNKEDADGKVITTSVFDATLQGINFLGYGKDADGDPKNIVSIVRQMADICDKEGGKLSKEEYDELFRLTGKMEKASDTLKKEHVAMDARSGQLKSNLVLLEQQQDTLTEQYAGIEDVDDADAISAFIWAQYSYNAALRVGNSVLAQSLMDYMQ